MSGRFQESITDRLLDGDGLVEVYFQPVVAFDTGRVVAAEALLRASVNGRGIAPLEVVADAVSGGRIRDLGRCVLDIACGQAIRWQRDDEAGVGLMVNLDASELLDEHLCSEILDTIDQHGLDRSLLTIEITESALISDSLTASTNLAGLRQAGVDVALDDFGTGFASLAHLKSIPMTTIKLDRSFVAGAAVPGLDHEIARSIVHLAHNVGLRTVAEGIETQAQWNALHALGCDEWQGFLRAAALDAESFERELSDERNERSLLTTHTRRDSGGDELLDTFVLRRIAPQRWAHLGGSGRGAGWAGILDIDERETPALTEALDGEIVHVSHDSEQWMFAAYHTRNATFVQVDPDSVVVFGAPPNTPFPSRANREWRSLATAEASTVTSVSAAKRLADELELSEALQEMVSKTATTLDEAMRHVVECIAKSLSCEFGAIYLPSHDLVAFADSSVAPPRTEELFAALDMLAASTNDARCYQDAVAEPFPVPVPDALGVCSWMAIPVASSLGGVVICAHTERQPRGFTTLCQRLGARLADAAELILHTAIDRDRLNAQADLATTMAHRDALTGVMNRRGWNDAVERLDPDAIFSVVIVDANDLKLINDRDGHAAGDQLLTLISRCLEGLGRSTDTVARLGGDEFGVLFPGADANTARRMRSRLLEVFDLERLVHPELSVAHGFATRRPNESNLDVICRADATMYNAKRTDKTARETGIASH